MILMRLWLDQPPTPTKKNKCKRYVVVFVMTAVAICVYDNHEAVIGPASNADAFGTSRSLQSNWTLRDLRDRKDR